MDKKVFFEVFGHSVLGPAILGYVTWIERRLKEFGIKKVFFLAREGQFIKRAFDIISTDEYDERYLYVSRRSLTIPAVATIESINDFLALHPMYDHLSAKQQIEELDINPDKFKKYTWYSEAAMETCLGNLSRDVKDAIIECMFRELQDQAKQELAELCMYLRQNEVNGKFAIVDLGWNGSMQRAMLQVLESDHVECDMVGFFLAQREGFIRNKNYINNKGFLFEYGKVSRTESLLLNSGTNLLEILFCANHGTTKCYEEKDGMIMPVLCPYEYAEEYSKIKICQDAAIQYVKEMYERNQLPEPGMETVMFKEMYRVLKRPTNEEIKFLGDLTFSDMKGEKQYLASSTKIFPIQEFVKIFRTVGWKTAFLKRNLHIPNSFALYILLRKIFH